MRKDHLSERTIKAWAIVDRDTGKMQEHMPFLPQAWRYKWCADAMLREVSPMTGDWTVVRCEITYVVRKRRKGGAS